MKVLFELHHPKHYYQVKNLLPFLNDYLFVIKAKDILEELLISEGVPFKKIGGVKSGLLSKLMNSVGLIKYFNKIIKDYKPDVMLSKASPYSVFLSPFHKFKTIITPDSEVVALTNHFVSKMADSIITQHCFEKSFGKKHKKLDTFFESCYLHPDYFQPDSNLLKKYGIHPDEKYIVLRFIGWGANHDIGKTGLDDTQKIELVEKLEKYARVIISSEKELPDDLKSRHFTAPPNIMHHVLYYASLYIGDSQSMATEAALLGTPAIRSNSFVGPDDMSNFKFLENQLNMLFNYKNMNDAINQAFFLLNQKESKKEWLLKRNAYFSSIVDPNKQFYHYTNAVM